MRRVLAWEGRTRDLLVADNSQMVLKVQVVRNQECTDKNECDWKLFSEFPALRSVQPEIHGHVIVIGHVFVFLSGMSCPSCSLSTSNETLQQATVFHPVIRCPTQMKNQ